MVVIAFNSLQQNFRASVIANLLSLCAYSVWTRWQKHSIPLQWREMFSYQHWKLETWRNNLNMWPHLVEMGAALSTRAVREESVQDSGCTGQQWVPLRVLSSHSCAGGNAWHPPHQKLSAHTREPFFHPAPAKYILRTTHKGNYQVLPTEIMVAEMNSFPLLSNISFDIFWFFFHNNNKTNKYLPRSSFWNFLLCVFINEWLFLSPLSPNKIKHIAT